MIVEDQYGVGDVIDLGEATGTVEAVTLRVTRLRDINGTVWYVPNGEILRVGNMSQNWSRAVVDVSVAYSEDLNRVKRVLKEIAVDLWDDDDWRELIIEEPEVTGVELLAADSVNLRVMIKTLPMEQWAVARELRQRIKARFDHEGIEIPFAQRVVWHREEQQRRAGVRGRRGGLSQGCVEKDLDGRECLADRAALLGGLSRGDEVLLAHPLDRAPDLQADLRDAGAGHEVDLGRGVQRRGRRTGLGQAVGERHGEARGVRGGDELLGAGLAIGLLGTRGPGHVERAETRGVEGGLAGALEEAAFPVGGRGASSSHARSLPRAPQVPRSWSPPRGHVSECSPVRQDGPVTFYDEIGGEETFRRIVARFYEGVADDPVLRPLYPEEDLGPAEERFRLFLIQYWGGPTTYSDTRGHPRLRMRHAPFAVSPVAAQRWLVHFRAALDDVALTPEQDAQFWDYVTHAAQFMVNTFEEPA